MKTKFHFNRNSNKKSIDFYFKILKNLIFNVHKLLQTPPSGYGGPGVLDELVYSGAGSGCRDDDEDACVLPDAGSGDDLITPVYVPSTRRPPSRLHKVSLRIFA